jgi:type I restriction enzyme M protein
VSADKSNANKFCKSTDLSNEASVETFFVARLLSDLGYEDSEIRTKKAIQELRVPKGSRSEPYKPDYLLVCRKLPRWLIDAKSTTERVEDFTYQCAGYALQINRKYEQRPLRYYMLTNGLLTRVYVWDQEEAILSLRFSDFADGNAKYETLRRLLGAQAARAGWPIKEADEQPLPFGKPAPRHLLSRPSMDMVKRAFLRCHRIIWKSEKMSPQAAFVEFAKLLFVKLWEDRRLRDNPQLLEMIGKGEPLPASEVRFSTRWISEQEPNDPNPIETLLFRQLVDFLEQEIAQRKRKRIFEPNERLRLSPGTAKRVVHQLEDNYLFGIDEDLNGRMFEAFLAATMRGQALGQYFTPRSIVKLVTKLAHLHAGPDKVERVLDACCGTGGFLIEALTEMRRQVWDNQSLTKAERTKLLDEVANQAIFGVDAGRDPKIARIARINMYLHGDGGSRVYMADALRHPPEPSEADTVEEKNEVKELRQILEKGLEFDAVLTNPPFSMDYSANVPEEEEVLDTYDLATYGGRKKSSLRSSVMFIERYGQLLKAGGRLLTVIDDSVLSGKNYAVVRDFIRERFIIRGIISLHGDAFQRAGARAKTSVLYLTKRHDVDETQPAAFVYESRYIGLDDVVPRTRQSVAELARSQAAEEINEIAAAFEAYLRGEKGSWLVPPERLKTRLDAKSLRPWSVVELAPKWQQAGADSDILENLVEPVEEHVTLDPDERHTFLRISYEGRAEHGEQALGREVSYSRIGRARIGDIVVSNISAVYKAICVIPEGMDGLLVSNEFTVMRLKPGVDADPEYIWSVLRSSAVIAEWLSSASGVGRTRVDWGILRSQRIPLLPPKRQREIGELYRAAEEHERQVARTRQAAQEKLAALGLEGQTARDRLARAKPPR